MLQNNCKDRDSFARDLHIMFAANAEKSGRVLYSA